MDFTPFLHLYGCTGITPVWLRVYYSTHSMIPRHRYTGWSKIGTPFSYTSTSSNIDQFMDYGVETTKRQTRAAYG